MPKHDPILAALGQNVRRRREARELPQEKLAERASLDPMSLAHRMGEGGAGSLFGIERGLRNPGIKNVARLAKALGLSAAELCKGVDA